MDLIDTLFIAFFTLIYAVACFLLGLGFYKYILNRSIASPWLLIALCFLIGRLIFVSLYAILVSDGKTSAWMWLISLTIFSFGYFKSLDKTEVIEFKKIPLQNLSFAIFYIIIVNIGYQYWSLNGFDGNAKEESIVNIDNLIYTSNAVSINNSGVENCIPEAAVFESAGLNIYHYFDLYECNLLSFVSNSSAYYVYSYSLYAISFCSIFLFLLSFMESKGIGISFKSLSIAFLVSCLPTLQIGWIWTYVDGFIDFQLDNEILLKSIPHFNILVPKVAVVASTFLGVLILFRQNAKSQSYALLLLATSFNPKIFVVSLSVLSFYHLTCILKQRNIKSFLNGLFTLLPFVVILKLPDLINSISGIENISRISFLKVSLFHFDIKSLIEEILVVFLLGLVCFFPFFVLAPSLRFLSVRFKNISLSALLFSLISLGIFLTIFPDAKTHLPGPAILIVVYLILIDCIIDTKGFLFDNYKPVIRYFFLILVGLYFSMLFYLQFIAGTIYGRQPVYETFTKQALSLLSANRASNWGAYIYPENQKAEMPLYNRLGKEMLLYSNKYQALCISMPYLEKTLADKEIASFTLANPYYRYAKLNFDRKEEENQLAFLKEKNINWVIVDSAMVNKVPHLRAKTILRTIDATRGHELWMLKK